LSVDRPLILDFDIENRPLSYMGNDFTTADITAIAFGFAGNGRAIVCAQLGLMYSEDMLNAFHVAYEAADIVTGHYIRRHDLPIINGAMVELGIGPLGPKLTIDTKLDLVKWSFQAQPKSQEELGLALGIESPKIHMSQQDWREANRLTPAGIEKTRERVVGDVRQHQQLRLELTRRGLLTGPKLWEPKVS
jgi:hypothetical protein